MRTKCIYERGLIEDYGQLRTLSMVLDGPLSSRQRKKRTVRNAFLFELRVRRELSCLLVELRDHYAMGEISVSGDNHAPVVRLEGKPVRHVVLAEHKPRRFLWRGRI